MHPSTFEYLKPTDTQMTAMARARALFANFADTVSPLIPDGPDKVFVMRQLRDCAMWVNVAITRQDDGSPRT